MCWYQYLSTFVEVTPWKSSKYKGIKGFFVGLLPHFISSFRQYLVLFWYCNCGCPPPHAKGHTSEFGTQPFFFSVSRTFLFREVPHHHDVVQCLQTKVPVSYDPIPLRVETLPIKSTFGRSTVSCRSMVVPTFKHRCGRKNTDLSEFSFKRDVDLAHLNQLVTL